MAERTTGAAARGTGSGHSDDVAPLPRKQQAIIDTGKALFRRFGIRRVTVEEICREASVSKATYYKYFENKEALVRHIVRSLSDDALARLASVEGLDISFAEKVRMLTEDRLERTRQASDEFIAELMAAGGELAALVGRIQQRTQDRLMRFISDAQLRGEVRASIRLPYVLAMQRKLAELAADESLRQHYPDFTAFTREINDFFFYGLLGPQRAQPAGTPGNR